MTSDTEIKTVVASLSFSKIELCLMQAVESNLSWLPSYYEQGIVMYLVCSLKSNTSWIEKPDNVTAFTFAGLFKKIKMSSLMFLCCFYSPNFIQSYCGSTFFLADVSDFISV